MKYLTKYKEVVLLSILAAIVMNNILFLGIAPLYILYHEL